MALNEFKQKCMDKIYRYREFDKKRFGVAGDICMKDIEELLVKQNYACYVCKEPVLLNSWTKYCLYQFSIDRINEHLPHDRDNFLISCFHCNSTFYCREGAEKKLCIHGCHTEEKVFNTTRKEQLPIMEHLQLSNNTDRDIQIKKAFELIYENKKSAFNQQFISFRGNLLHCLLEKRILFQHLFIIFKEGEKQLYAPTKEFLKQLFDLRMRMHSSMEHYVCMTNTTIRSFDDWYTEIQTKRRFEDRCPILITPKGVSIDSLNDSQEIRFNLKLEKKIQKVFSHIYKKKSFEFNPIQLINITGLNEYFSFNIRPVRILNERL